ncbi:MAG TPA: ABC transporter ATP-binding protein, partial [Candidatus Merdenecus merdavium]|nr:ABC transporter ATP-binding protein [Candidatus Merdenecus merdavium]
LVLKGVNKKVARDQVYPHLLRFGLEGNEKKYPHQLSGGMRQRAALLRTYMFSQKITLLDEPFSALDTFTKKDMYDWYLKMMEDLHLSTLFITHDIDEAILLSDRIYLLKGKPGRITDEIIIREPRMERKDFSLKEEFLEYKREILKKLKR